MIGLGRRLVDGPRIDREGAPAVERDARDRSVAGRLQQLGIDGRERAPRLAPGPAPPAGCRSPPSMMVTVCMPAGVPLTASRSAWRPAPARRPLGSAVSALAASVVRPLGLRRVLRWRAPPPARRRTGRRPRRPRPRRPRRKGPGRPATTVGSRTGNFQRLRFLPWPSGAFRSSATARILANHADDSKAFRRDSMPGPDSGGRRLGVARAAETEKKRGGPGAAPRINRREWRASVRHGAFRVGREGRIGLGAAQELEGRICSALSSLVSGGT